MKERGVGGKSGKSQVRCVHILEVWDGMGDVMACLDESLWFLASSLI